MPGMGMAMLAAFRPFTTQKALLSMLTLSAALSIAWAVLAYEAWDLLHGTLDVSVSLALRVAFYGTDFFLAATTFTLYTILAKFWADLTFSARQGAGASRPLGGGDEYRPRGTTLIWKVTRGVQRVSSTVVFAAAALATVLQAVLVTLDYKYLNLWKAYVEGGVFILAAFVMVTAAYYAVVELRLVPIELPTRRRRVCRVVAMTGSVAVCLVLRAVVLVWVASKPIFVNTDLEMLALLGYWVLLVALPSSIVLAYNRVVPLSSYSGGRGGTGNVSLRWTAPDEEEEEPLIPPGVATGTRFDGSNTFAGTRIPTVHS
ncbi:unnamed protein product [Ectocarpus sp. CCAP 1310/34]|nr:unnamed protein product [Ectocarpus sp. CCAP 1310/34]